VFAYQLSFRHLGKTVRSDSSVRSFPDVPLAEVVFRPGEVELIFRDGRVLFVPPEATLTTGKEHRALPPAAPPMRP
jgi:hypothetical protein